MHTGTGRGRSVAIDVARVIGMVAVVTGHAMGSGARDVPNVARLATFSWHVPFFFFLTGYLWTSGRGLRAEIRTRARTLLLPYVAWTALFAVPIFTLTTFTSGLPVSDIWLTLLGGGQLRASFAPYWFLPMLFLVAVLLRLLERAPRWVSWALALSGLAVSYVWGTPLSHLPHDVFFLLPCLLFALAGQEIRAVRDRITRPVVVGSALLAVGGAFTFSHIAAPLDLKQGNFGTPLLSVAVALAISTGLLLVLQGLLPGTAYRWGGFVSGLAATSVVVLVTHLFFFRLFETFVPPPVVLALSLTASWLLGMAIHRTRLSPVLAGIPRHSRRATAPRDGAVAPAVTSREAPGSRP